MKPTQQDLIRIARLAGFHVGDQFVAGASEDDLKRFAALLLERFGAGGGEPSRDMPHGWATNWPAPNGGTRPVYHASAIKPKYGPELDNSLVSYPVFTRPGPSPTEGGEPVVLDHIACICDGELRYMSGRKAPAHDCELYAMPDGKATPVLYTHPSPTNLRAEYLRGLEDAKKVALDADHMGSVNLKLMKNRISNAIEALKCKQ